MGKIEITRTMYGPFGNCVKIANGIIELYVTTDFGPRIIHCSRVGMENVLYNDNDKAPLGKKFEIYNGDIIKLYGGHRIWVAPEITPRCYHPDNNTVLVTETENGAVFAGDVEEYTQIQKIMTVEITENDESVKIKHTVVNMGLWDIELAPWCITMLDAGGISVMPMPAEQTELLPNRNFTFWPYTNISDERVFWGKSYVVLKQDKSISQPFKIGYNNQNGWAAYFNKGQAFFKYFKPEKYGEYPDNNCCYETYTNNVMLESESLGEMTILLPGDEVEHFEEWKLFAESAVPSLTDEAGISALVKKYI